MPKIQSGIDVNSEGFAKNSAFMQGLIDEFRGYEAQVRSNSEARRATFEKRGQLLPRDRLALLLDRGSPFLEIQSLAGLNMHDDDGKKNAAGGGNIAGIGYVEGKRCMVIATDSAIKGGSVPPMGLQKGLRLQEIVKQQKLPLVTLAESAGANLLYQSEIFIHGGRSFANQARLSAAGIPQITVVHGSSTAGGAYLPGLSDYNIMVRDKSKVFLAGPPLLKAATGEVATDEELGGAQMHIETAGTGEYMAEDDAHAVEMAREVIRHLRWDDYDPAIEGAAPLYSADELIGIVPDDTKKPYDVREIIARIVDGSDFLGFKDDFGTATVCGHAHIDGLPVGILGNNGPIDAQGAVKAAQFIQLCCQSDTPILFLMNTTGFLVGRDAEQAGIVKHGSKMIQAVANASVPRLTVVVGGSWGAGNYGMCGRGFDPDFIFSWPSAKVGVMGPEQAATVMQIITEEKFAKQGQQLPEEMATEMKNTLIKRMEPETTALFATARIWDDGIIDPRDTRKVLSMALSVCEESRRRPLKPSSFGVARG